MGIDEQEKKMLERGVLKVPVALLGVFIFMSAQTFGAIWWASHVNTTLRYVQQSQTEIKQISSQNSKDRYTSIDAKNDFASVAKDMGAMQAQYQQLNDRVTGFQSRYEPVLIKMEGKYR